MIMKKFGARLLAAAVAGSLIVTPVMAAPSINDLKEDKAEKQSEVNSLQKELTDIMTKLGDLEEDLIKKGEEITQAEADLTVAEEKEKEQYEAMKLRIKYMYEEGSSMAIESLVSAEDFTDLVNKAEYVQNVHKYDRQQLQEYAETKQEIADLKTTLEEDQKTMEGLQDEYEAKETQLSSTIESKREEVADLDAQIQAAAEAAARAAAEEQRRREEEERRRQEEAAQSNNNTSSNQNRNNEDNNGGNASNDSASAGNTGSTGGSSTAGNTGSTGNSGSTGNTTGSTGTSTGSGSGSSLDYAGAGDSSVAQTIVNAAYGQLGVPYVWGGTTPGSGLDCSGLTQYCHRVAGISIGRTSQVQGGGGKAVSNPQPGDLVCYGSHIGIYIGGGQMIHAPHTGDVVKVANVYGSPWYRRYW
ncbi:MAG: hydrolase [Dorea sp.]|nr:hydrolase [Dorea sp.]